MAVLFDFEAEQVNYSCPCKQSVLIHDSEVVPTEIQLQALAMSPRGSW